MPRPIPNNRHPKNQTQPSFICNSLPPGEHGLAKILAVFYLQKYFEYWDTYFFIMRRSFRQVRASFVCIDMLCRSTGSPQSFNPATALDLETRPSILEQVTFLHLFHHASITVIVGSLLPLDYGARETRPNVSIGCTTYLIALSPSSSPPCDHRRLSTSPQQMETCIYQYW